MGWEDRIREAAYTAPSGARYTFNYEDVSQSIDKSTSAFDFPDANGTYIQDLGHSGRRFPLLVYFWGDNCDVEAQQFDAALIETGPGVLEHPIYGRVDVVPFGTISRRDDLVTGANQVVINVVFWQTTGVIYPTGLFDPAAAVFAALDRFGISAAFNFAKSVVLKTATTIASFEERYSVILGSAKGILEPITEKTESIKRQVDAIEDSIKKSIGVLSGDTETLAAQTLKVIQLPSSAAADIGSKLTAYGDISSQIVSLTESSDARVTDNTRNDYATNSLFASAAISGASLSAVNAQFQTRGQAIEAAESILILFDNMIVWRDNATDDLEVVDTGEDYQQLQEVVALTAGYLLEISFSLRQERTITLDRDRTVIDLCGQLYGSIDDSIDSLISSNDLSGSEILELPRGRKIVYYI